MWDRIFSLITSYGIMTAVSPSMDIRPILSYNHTPPFLVDTTQDSTLISVEFNFDYDRFVRKLISRNPCKMQNFSAIKSIAGRHINKLAGKRFPSI